MADRRKRRLDRVGGADALPVRGRKAAGCRQFLDRFRLLLPIGVDKPLERRLGMVPGLGHPDLSQHLLGAGQDAFGQDVQDVAHLVQPAALWQALDALDPARPRTPGRHP